MDTQSTGPPIEAVPMTRTRNHAADQMEDVAAALVKEGLKAGADAADALVAKGSPMRRPTGLAKRPDSFEL